MLDSDEMKPKKDKVGFWDWFWHGKGTANEPSPTVREVLSDPEVKKRIKIVREDFEKSQKNK